VADFNKNLRLQAEAAMAKCSGFVEIGI
jgi:hypothetical protein